MMTWYEGLHAWNRIPFAGFCLAVAWIAVFQEFSLERTLAAPVIAVIMWACGWAAIYGSRLLGRAWKSYFHPTPVMQVAIPPA